MKKRILSLLLTMLLVFSFMPLGGVSASETDKTEAENAIAFVESIVGTVTVSKENVNRSEFVGAMAQLLKLDTSVAVAQVYSDVNSSNAYANAINQAYNLGWISYSENFRPSENITYPEAVKIAVFAMGYDAVAAAQGGYPTGYLWVADRIGLLNRLSMTEDQVLSKGELMIFMENMLNAKIAKIVGTGIMDTYDTEETLMEYYYDIYKVKGIIDATKHSSLTSETDEFPRDMISINGVSYYYDGYSDDYLGYNVHAYCRYDEEKQINKVVYLKFINNGVYEYNSTDYTSLNNGKIQFEDEDRTFSDKHTVDNSYILVYNGKKVTDKSNATTYLKNANGYVKLLDNDDDGSIDVIFVEDYRYIFVSEVNAEFEIISDQNSSENNLKLEEVDYVIYDKATGEEVGFEDIKISSVVGVAMSKDSKVAKLILCDEEISGTPESFGSDGVVFNGVEYDESAYYKKYYMSTHNKYEPGVYYFGINNDIVAYSASATNMTYGYVIQSSVSNGLDAVTKVKVLNDNGKVNIYELNDRVMFDGIWKDDDKCNMSALTNTLIKYGLSNGKIKYVDTPVDLTMESMYEESSYDSMTQATLPSIATTGRYRSNGYGFENGYYATKAAVFIIDESDVEYGSIVGNYGYLESGNQSYTGKITFYDVGGVGFAGAIVTTINAGDNLSKATNSGSVIHSVTQAIDDEGEECYKIKLMTYQGYLKTYYMDYDLMPTKSSGKILGFGDIVKTIVNNEDTRIINMYPIWDGETMTDESADGLFAESLQGNHVFRQGVVYDYNNNHISYSNTKDTKGNYLFTLDTLRFQNVNTTNLVTIDRETKTLRKGYQNDFKSYRDYEENASRVVIMYNYTNSQGVFIYEN